MHRQKNEAWVRHQWVGDQGARDVEAAPAPNAQVARWDLHQWVGDQGAGEPAAGRYAFVRGDDGMPHGYDGFGVSDSGGQQWAPGVAVSELLTEALAVSEIVEEEEVA
jgi:hypothetical protein